MKIGNSIRSRFDLGTAFVLCELPSDSFCISPSVIANRQCTWPNNSEEVHKSNSGSANLIMRNGKGAQTTIHR